MRKFAVAIILLILGGYGFFSCTQRTTPPEKLIAQKLLAQVDSFALICHALQTHPTQQLFLQVRLAYKRFEWAAEYFDPTAALAVNGPPVREVEKSGLIVQPSGLQVIEAFLFPAVDSTKTQDLQHQVAILLAACERYKSHFANIDIFDWQVFDAAKLEVFRVMTLGITGFDDVAMPYRFEVELPLMADADIVGSGLLEFTGDTDAIVGQRVPPTDPAHIRRYARMHDPFNHPTVVYRRHAVQAAGGYGDLPLMEDYALFARMLGNGARAANVAEPLVFYRVGATAFKRRGGIALLRSELRLQREFRRAGFITAGEYLRNVAVRGGYRLVPWWCRRAVYKPVVTRYAGRLEAAGSEPDLEREAGRRAAEWDGYPLEWEYDLLAAAGPVRA